MTTTTAYVSTVNDQHYEISAHNLDIEVHNGCVVLVNARDELTVPVDELLTVEIRPNGLLAGLCRCWYRLFG